MNVIRIVDIILILLTAAIFTRAILSFIVPLSGSRPPQILLNFHAAVVQLTEPILGPIRRILPPFGGLDFSPMVALIILWVIRAVLAGRF